MGLFVVQLDAGFHFIIMVSGTEQEWGCVLRIFSFSFDDNGVLGNGETFSQTFLSGLPDVVFDTSFIYDGRLG